MKNANQSAIPVPLDHAYCEGLTKRELFAAMAMQGMLSKPAEGIWKSGDVVTLCVQYADALLDELGARAQDAFIPGAETPESEVECLTESKDAAVRERYQRIEVAIERFKRHGFSMSEFIEACGK